MDNRSSRDPVSLKLASAMERHRAAHLSRGVPDMASRRDDLERLIDAVRQNKETLVQAVNRDFGHRSREETLAAEIMGVINEARHAHRHLGRWMRPKRRWASPLFLPARTEVRFRPKGTVGIISPWNYPVLLTLAPLINALAAGNRVMLKPSEFAPETATALDAMIGSTFAPEQVSVHTGGKNVAKALSELALDHLMFTGSGTVGKMVMQAAAKNLVPVTLELGGKSPAIVHADYPLRKAAERIAFGKLFNAGQTCIAPDYVVLVGAAQDEFVQAMQQAVGRLYPTFADNPDYTAIINDKQAAHLTGLLDDARTKGATLVKMNPHASGGEACGEASGRVHEPILVLDVNDDMRIMHEEVFGPLLPVLSCATLDDAMGYINARPHPLAFYYFDNDAKRIERVLANTISGGACINETLLHFGQQHLPFGGVGASGMGRYHGFDGFEAFSHKRAIFHQSRFNATFIANPPFGRVWKSILKFIVR